MSDKNAPESEEQSNFVAITCYVLGIIFLFLALFGYGRLHESWPPEIDGSVQKSLIIAFVLFLIPSVKEMNIAGVLSFKAKVEEAKAEVKEMREEVRHLMSVQLQNSVNVGDTYYVPKETFDEAMPASIRRGSRMSGGTHYAMPSERSLQAEVATLVRELQPSIISARTSDNLALDRMRMANLTVALRDSLIPLARLNDDDTLGSEPASAGLIRTLHSIAKGYDKHLRSLWPPLKLVIDVIYAYETGQRVEHQTADRAFEAGALLVVKFRSRLKGTPIE